MRATSNKAEEDQEEERLRSIRQSGQLMAIRMSVKLYCKCGRVSLSMT